MKCFRLFTQLFFLLGTLLFCPGLLQADQSAATTEETVAVVPGEAVPELNIPGIRVLDVTHLYFSNNIEGLSDSVDSFFGDDRIFEEASGTYVQVRGSVIYSKYGTLNFDTRLRAKFKLTNLNRLADRVQLLLSGDDDLPGSGTITSGGEFGNAIDDLDPAVSLQFSMLELRRWDLRLQPGLKFRAPVDPFFKIRLRRQQQFGENWLWRTVVYPAWYKSKGYEFPVGLDLERGVGDGGFFRSSTGVYWFEEENKNLFARQSFFYSHPFGQRNKIGYEVGVGFEREPRWRDTGYYATIRYRANIHRGWIFLEVKPQLVFERGADFKPDPSLALTLEMFFGGAYL